MAPRKRSERFLGLSNPEHAKGSVCDPWLHQVASFAPMAKMTEYALLSPDNIPNQPQNASSTLNFMII